ncbi:hypothetical protein GTA08_BOTSDO08722 [Neofusicoccum parvum]|uniref:Uncharacterized protein n=1 Tax=Neofusicoccum parvum TaxID=310453 RepID=A0ACB5SG11_9PEZI|nr:hypothetical protein GTA08_BOTSDO08722 [Neofusicoccum parvum]
MPPAPPFAPPRKSGARSQSLRASLHGQDRKRRRDDDADDEADGSDHASFSAGNDAASTRRISAITTLSSAQATQFRIAGHDPDHRLPRRPFPHAPADPAEHRFTPSELHHQLAALKPPLYAPRLSAAARFPTAEAKPVESILQRRLHALTSIMHLSLLEGNYERAGRAWKILLTAEKLRHRVEERDHSRWGINAEMRLRGISGSKRDVDHASQTPPSDVDDSMFSEDGFKAARMHYERLILEYPFQQSHPQATNALTFYPAMFSLWIYEASQTSRVAIAAAEESDSAQEDDESDDTEDAPNRNVSRREARILAARADELRRAQEIAARLDDLLSSPHFDKRADLLHLRGMVTVWIGDLISEIQQSERSAHDEASLEDAETNGGAAREAHIAKARELFNRAKANGGHLSEGAKQLLGDVED